MDDPLDFVKDCRITSYHAGGKSSVQEILHIPTGCVLKYTGGFHITREFAIGEMALILGDGASNEENE